MTKEKYNDLESADTVADESQACTQLSSQAGTRRVFLPSTHAAESADFYSVCQNSQVTTLLCHLSISYLFFISDLYSLFKCARTHLSQTVVGGAAAAPRAPGARNPATQDEKGAHVTLALHPDDAALLYGVAALREHQRRLLGGLGTN